jgi:hypothetical protein
MTKAGKRVDGMKKQADKLKAANLGPWRYLLSIAAFIVTLFFLPAVFKGSHSFWDGLSWFYLIIAALATLIDVIQGRVSWRVKLLIPLFLSYLLRIFLEILLMVLALPVLALMFVLGPVMFIIGMVSLGMVVMYVIEVLLGIDIKGASVPYGGLTALAALAAMLISGYVFFRFLDKSEGLLDLWLDKIIDVFLFFNLLGKPRQAQPGQSAGPGDESTPSTGPHSNAGT